MYVHWVAVQCEASRASEAMPTAAEASEATCSVLTTLLVLKLGKMTTNIELCPRSSFFTHCTLHHHTSGQHTQLNQHECIAKTISIVVPCFVFYVPSVISTYTFTCVIVRSQSMSQWALALVAPNSVLTHHLTAMGALQTLINIYILIDTMFIIK